MFLPVYLSRISLSNVWGWLIRCERNISETVSRFLAEKPDPSVCYCRLRAAPKLLERLEYDHFSLEPYKYSIVKRHRAISGYGAI